MKLFLASSSEVYGKNPKPRWNEDDDLVFGPTTRTRWSYGATKAIDEFLALAYWRERGLPVVIGRLFNVVGPRQVGRLRHGAAAADRRGVGRPAAWRSTATAASNAVSPTSPTCSGRFWR